jgi:hypothetical protein
MNRIESRLLLLPILLAVTGVALLGVQPAACETITATVVSVDAQGITVETSEGMQREFPLSADVMVPSTATPGSRVNLTVNEDMNGVQQVTSISMDTAAGTQTGAANADMDELPATASPVWILGSIGFLALLGGITIRRYRRIQEKRHLASRLI